MRDKEVVRHALAWVDYKRESFASFTEQEAEALKTYLSKPPAPPKRRRRK